MFNNSIKKLLIGEWKIDSNNLESIKIYGDTILEFVDNSRLVYHIDNGDKEQLINLTYKIKGNLLITNQPSFPKEEKTKFEIINDKNLILFYDNITTSYNKIR